MPDLTSASHVDEDPETYVRRCGTVVRTFDHRTQDSGNVSWLVESAGQRLFVKSAGTEGSPQEGAPVPSIDHAGRVVLLRNAVELARSCDHPTLPELLNVIESPRGPVLVYDAVDGELVHVPGYQRGDPASPYQRFAHLPAPVLLDHLGALVELHVDLEEQGWVAGDLYDGCLIVDFEKPALHVVDLDSYRRGPSTNDMGQMFGSTRFMAPEEHELGARLDERTTVFTLGRIAWHFATRLTEDPSWFCGTDELAAVLRVATRQSPSDRYARVVELATAWTDAQQSR